MSRQYSNESQVDVDEMRVSDHETKFKKKEIEIEMLKHCC